MRGRTRRGCIPCADFKSRLLSYNRGPHRTVLAFSDDENDLRAQRNLTLRLGVSFSFDCTPTPPPPGSFIPSFWQRGGSIVRSRPSNDGVNSYADPLFLSRQIYLSRCRRRILIPRMAV